MKLWIASCGGEAYAILGVTPEISDADLTKAYKV